MQITGDGDFEGHNKSYCDYVLYDCLINGCIALVHDLDEGGYSGEMITHVDCGSFFHTTLREAVKELASEMEWYNRGG